MKLKKWLALCLVLSLSVALAACGSEEGAVFVQPVSELVNLGGIAPGDRFGGLVVSENITEIRKDDTMTVAELLVKEGDDVTAGQELFSYDTQQLQLSLDKQQLELDQLLASIENYKSQIAELEKQRKNNPKDQLQYTIEIQSLQVDLKEAELNVAAKENAVNQTSQVLENAVVVSPVDGRVQSISENGSDQYGNPLAYITIQQAGAFRIKGTLGELQRGAITEGTRMKIYSRTDPQVSWTGTVMLVDYESPSQSNPNDMVYGPVVDEMSASSKYPFYVELDSTDGLLLGLHVYMEVEGLEETTRNLSISSAFIAYGEDDGAPFVWAENRKKLEKRPVELGEYNMMNDTYEILSGLSESDHIAFPDPEVCVEGAAVTHSAPMEEAATESGVG